MNDGGRDLLNVRRHFALLGAASAVAVALAAAPGRFAPGPTAAFAWYGALHASALVFSVDRGASSSAARRLMLIAAGAMLAWLTARLGLLGLHTAARYGSPGGLMAVLAAAAGLGALAYGLAIGMILGGALQAGSLAAVALGCAATTCVAFAASRRLHLAGAIWLVVPWWFAFSGGFWAAARARSRRGICVSKSIR